MLHLALIQNPEQPECLLESSCGYVQLNGYGINAMQTCRCRGQVSCPLAWDPYDGQTIVHGNDQYKVSPCLCPLPFVRFRGELEGSSART